MNSVGLNSKNVIESLGIFNDSATMNNIGMNIVSCEYSLYETVSSSCA